jgi:hypothetical protein
MAEVTPLLVAGVDALLVSFGLYPLLPPLNRRSVLAGIVAAFGLTLVVVLATKPAPYSDEFPIVGPECELHFENGSSIAAFVPMGGRRVLNGIHASTDVEYIPDYGCYLLPRGPAWVVRTNRTKPPLYFPTFSELSVNGPIRHIRFDSGPLAPDTESVALVVKCGSDRCVESIERFPEFTYRATPLGPNTVIVRITPVFVRQTLDIWLRGDGVAVDVLYTSQRVSPERSRLRAALGPHVCEFAKERFLSDDIEFFNRRV